MALSIIQFRTGACEENSVDHLFAREAERKPILSADEPRNTTKVFGFNVRALREQRGMSRRQLSKLADLDETQIAAIEAGLPGWVDLTSIVRIKASLGVTYHDLIGGIV